MNTKSSTTLRLLPLTLAITLVAALSFFAACSDDCDDLRRDVDDLRLRVEKLEDWCNTANSQISALQGLVSALEANDYVTSVTPIVEGSREIGYTIQFSKSGPITILHGKDGANGTNGTDGKDGANGLTPLIGAAKDADGIYYWTVKTGDAAPQWLTDAQGNKIPTTGKDGADGNDGANGLTPLIGVAKDADGIYYWTVKTGDAAPQWLTDAQGNKIPTTGKDGADGNDGTNGLTPLIGVAKDADGLYYWTVKTGDAAPQWLTDAQGNKIPTTGKDGADGSDGSDGADAQPPVISVATFEGALYWQVNGQWLLDGNNAKVPATGPAGPQGPQGDQGIQGPAGPQGDAVFAPDGVTVDKQAGYVTFTLADKFTTFRLPLYGATVIRFESNETLMVDLVDGARAFLLLPNGFPKSDYGALMAEVVAPSDDNSDIVTRGASNNWKVKLEPPVFHDNGNIDDPYVEITPPQDINLVGTKALLRITLVHSNGYESTVSRVLLITNAILYDYTLEEQLTDPGVKPWLEASGTNSAHNPYLIKSAENLQWLKQNPSYGYYYKLTKNIRVTGTDSQGNWVPIGKKVINDVSAGEYPFQGQFDGNGKKVSGIVASVGYDDFGFFGTCQNAEIRNLTYEGSMDLSRLGDRTSEVGAIAGSISGGTITHCSNSADLTCKESVNVGGIVGYLSSTSRTISIEACTNTGNIETGGHAGGIAGMFNESNSSLVGCINTGNIKTNGSTYVYAGGIVGQVEGNVMSCWSNATSITHQNNGKVGGIAGGTSGMSALKACLWKEIPGMEGIDTSGGDISAMPPFESFTGDRPDAEGIRQMNEAWQTANPSGKYRFNATTGEIEAK